MCCFVLFGCNGVKFFFYSYVAICEYASQNFNGLNTTRKRKQSNYLKSFATKLVNISEIICSLTSLKQLHNMLGPTTLIDKYLFRSLLYDC